MGSLCRRAQENRLAKRLQESQDRLRETEAKVQELQSEVDQLQSQLKTQQTEKAQAEAEGKLDAENLRKALEQLEAERAGEEKPRAKSHDRQPIEKHMPSLSENVGSQDGREVTSFLSDEKVLTDQSQQTDPGQLEEPQTNSLAQEGYGGWQVGHFPCDTFLVSCLPCFFWPFFHPLGV